MALTTIAITQGAGTAIEVDSSSSGYMQVIKLAESTPGSTSLVPASASTGLLVNVGTPAVTQSGSWNIGAVTSITDTVTVAGTVAVSGTVTVAGTVAISGTAAVTQSGSWTVAITGTAAVTQSGSWNIGTVATITNPVTVTGTVGISGTVPVSGTVTGNQGSAASVASAWPIKVTDGTNTATLQSVGGVYSLPVKVTSITGGGYSQQDKTAFTEGTTFVEVIGGVYNDAFAGSPAAGQASVLRITAQRAAHVNLRSAGGTEIGTSGAPVRTDPTGTTTQPVSGTVSAAQSGSWNVEVGSHALTAANPIPVQSAPSTATGQTPWKAHVVLAASQTSIAVHTPASGKTAYVEGFAILLSAGTGLLEIYDATNSASTRLWAATVTWAFLNQAVTPARPIPTSAANNVIRYDSGSAVVGDLVMWGYDA